MTDTSAIMRTLDQTGASISLRDGKLLLRAGRTPVDVALLQQIQESKAEIRKFLIEKMVVDWLNANPEPSAADRCAYCYSSHPPIVPFGTEPGCHTWLHSECWMAWHSGRRHEAMERLSLTSA
jgi:hypothetical protein